MAGIIHTVPTLAGTFQSALDAALPSVDVVHVADPWLLATAIEHGVTDEVYRRLDEHVRYLATRGVDAVLVTCSSVGEAVEASSRVAAVPVLRVDEPMALEAVRRARAAGEATGRPGRVEVLATLEATLGPTGRLIRRYADAASGAVDVHSGVVEGAVAARDRGDQDGHDRLIRDAVARAGNDADVIVLAQASMAHAVDGVGLDVPVLTSPAGGVQALVDVLRAKR